MAKTIIATPNAPAAIGTYSQAIRVGDAVYLSGQIGLDLDAEQFDQTRLRVAEQRARDRTLAGFGLQADADQRVVIALAVVAHFAHLDAAFLHLPRPGRELRQRIPVQFHRPHRLPQRLGLVTAIMRRGGPLLRLNPLRL